MAASPLRIERPPARGFDPRALRREFPIFTTHPDLVFLDSGASAQKPRSVIDGIAEFYRSDYANVHRGVYQLSQRSTDAFEAGREKTRAFLNAADEREVVETVDDFATRVHLLRRLAGRLSKLEE